MKLGNILQDADELLGNLEDTPVNYKWNNGDEVPLPVTVSSPFRNQNLSEYSESISKIPQRLCDTKGEVEMECLNESLVQDYHDKADKHTAESPSSTVTG